MKFRMVTHMQGSTVSNVKFQCMTVHLSVNNLVLKDEITMSRFHPLHYLHDKKNIKQIHSSVT